MGDTYGLVNFIGGGRSGQVISSGDFLSLVDSKTILKSFLWSWSEKNRLVSYLEDMSLAAGILEDEWKKEDGGLTI